MRTNSFRQKTMIFQTIAEVTKVETLIKGLKLVFHTNELPPDEMAKIFSFYDKQGWLLFKGNAAIQPDEVKDLPEVKLDYGGESPGQRLRACLFFGLLSSILERSFFAPAKSLAAIFFLALSNAGSAD